MKPLDCYGPNVGAKGKTDDRESFIPLRPGDTAHIRGNPVMQELKPRSESDIITKELTLRFGDKEYTIPVLRMKAAAIWRKEYFRLTKEVSDTMPAKFEQHSDPKELSKAIGRGLMGALLEYPEKVPQLVFSYSKELEAKQDEILDAAYDQDFQRAFAQIWQVAFQPFLASLGMVMEMQRSQDLASRSSANSN